MKKQKETLFEISHNFFDAIKKNIEIEFKKMNISMHQYKVLKLLEKNLLTQKEIASAIMSDEPSTTRTLERLLKKEFIEKKNGLEDRRKNYISLTKKGKSIVKKLHKIVESKNEELEQNYEAKELEILCNLLTKHKIMVQ